MVTHNNMDNNILYMQYYVQSNNNNSANSPPTRKRRCINKEQDPMSHRIIEKRRRDRMNNCLADLSRLIPAEYLKKGRGRVEKTEIIEMAIRHMKHLQSLQGGPKHQLVNTVHGHPDDSVDSVSHPGSTASAADNYKLGFLECLSETIRFLADFDGFYDRDAVCLQLNNHLQQHCEKILATSDRLGFPHPDLSMLNDNMDRSPGRNDSTPMCNNHSENGSSSGVSSFEDPERPVHLTTIVPPPPTIVSDDSNHSSSHSHEAAPATPTSKQSNYKFKNSIKQRFSAERVRSSPLPTMLEKSHGVPIFALHDAGSFYVPLTVEASLLRPHLNLVPDTGPDMILHPVTISVNFNQSAPSAWSHPSPLHNS